MIQPKIQEVYIPSSNGNSRYSYELTTSSGVLKGKTHLQREYLITFTPEEFEQFKRELCKKLLEKAAENAKMKVQPSEMEEWEIVPNEITRKDVDDEESGCENFSITINKKSITGVLDEFLENNKI